MSFQQWLQQGEMLYQAAMQEYHALEAQYEELERRLAAKQQELSQLSTMMGKPAADSVKPNAPHAPAGSDDPNLSGNSPTIARALGGRSFVRPVQAVGNGSGT